ncbi:MAG: alkane 1-monooxygenase [Chitinophagaceae bacterium]|nr:alkane 1-monooxygenase [Chitinophagaceae bacterium]
MRLQTLKYGSPLILFYLAYLSFTYTGWITFLPIVWSYVVIPLAELFIKPNENNLLDTEEAIAKSDRLYDYLLYIIPLAMYTAVVYFMFSLQQTNLTWIDYTGRIFSMGLLCGVFGINVAHELGHRTNKFEQALAKSLLLTSLYLHFFIEHNRGHHKSVATPNDPSSARLNEWLFSFYGRTIVYSYISAWHIANADMKKKGHAVFSLHNQMILFTIIQVVFVSLIVVLFGWFITLCYLLSAFIGIALLETVNYIEHYGLQRSQIAPGKFERALPQHSWNSNHVVGRIMLFELSRHSDHHFMASRKYQLLRHHPNSPQMPTGYPGMMILAHIPPLFIYVMNRQIKKTFANEGIIQHASQIA